MPLLLESTTISWSATLNLSVLLHVSSNHFCQCEIQAQNATLSLSVLLRVSSNCFCQFEKFKQKMQTRSLSVFLHVSSNCFCQFERFKHEVQNSLSVLHIPSACFFRLVIQSTKCNQSAVVVRDSRRRRR